MHAHTHTHTFTHTYTHTCTSYKCHHYQRYLKGGIDLSYGGVAYTKQNEYVMSDKLADTSMRQTMEHCDQVQEV